MIGISVTWDLQLFSPNLREEYFLAQLKKKVLKSLILHWYLLEWFLTIEEFVELLPLLECQRKKIFNILHKYIKDSNIDFSEPDAESLDGETSRTGRNKKLLTLCAKHEPFQKFISLSSKTFYMQALTVL